MKKFATILLLAGALSMQCAKQLGYWECRIVAAISGTTGCDCEKLGMANGSTESPVATDQVVHRHFFPDDSYDAFVTSFSLAGFMVAEKHGLYNDHLVTGIGMMIDHPPENL